MTSLHRVQDMEDGVPLLLLHGLGGDHVQAMDHVHARPGYRRIALDMRGHGDTVELGTLDSLTIAAFAEDAVESMPPGQMRILGVSMGAAIAMHIAHRHPDRVDRLVLVRPAWLDSAMPDNLAIFPIVAALLRAGSGPDALQDHMEYRAIRTASEATARSIRGQFARERARDRCAVLDRVPKSAPVQRSGWRRIRADTLVLGAPGDPVHPITFATELARGISHAVFEELPVKDIDTSAHMHAARAAASSFLTA